MGAMVGGGGAWLIVLAVLAASTLLTFRVLPGADLGDVAFETLERRSSPNDALAAPPGFTQAKTDIESPIFDVPAAALRAAFDKVMASQFRTAKVASDDARLQDRYVERTLLMGYPDTVVVRFVDLAGGRSSIAIYSRSKYGYSDLGANKARLRRLLDALVSMVKPAG